MESFPVAAVKEECTSVWQDCLARLCVAACVQFICEAFACASAAAAANRVSERSGKDNDELAAGGQAGRGAPR